MSTVKRFLVDKKAEVTAFSSIAIALYGYDQGMMSLINTNYHYLATMGIGEEDPLVAAIVSVYYLGTAVGSILASSLADRTGRKRSIFVSLFTSVIGNLMMFVAGLGHSKGAIYVMLIGRFVMGLGIGGVDAVVPVYSSELNEEDGRGRAIAQEFQANIFGLNIAFILNIIMTRSLGKFSQWAWRTPIIAMNLFPVVLLFYIFRLPESPRWFMHKERDDDAQGALKEIYGEGDEAKDKFKQLKQASEEESSRTVRYRDMLLIGGSQFHPTMLTIMGQVNQALTGYGCISVYGPQIFELLGFNTIQAEYLTLGNYLMYLGLMTVAWMTIDVYGRRRQMVWGSVTLVACFALLAVFGGIVMEDSIHVPRLPFAIPGIAVLYIATSAFGIGWLPQPWLIPTEIYPSTARAQGAAISVVVWGFMNFAVPFLSPIFFNNLKYWIFLIFAGTNALAGALTYVSLPFCLAPF